MTYLRGHPGTNLDVKLANETTGARPVQKSKLEIGVLSVISPVDSAALVSRLALASYER